MMLFRSQVPAHCALALGTLVAILTPPCGAQARQAPKISPDLKIQELIRQVIYAPNEDDKQLREALKAIREIAIRAPESLGPQLIYYGARAKNEKEGVGMLMMIHRLGPNSALQDSIVPFLESDNQRVQEEASIWLYNMDGEETLDPSASKLRFYYDTLLRQKKAPPPGLVSYVFEISPSRALLLFGRIYSPKPKAEEPPRPLLWSDHLVTTVKWRLSHRFLKKGDLEAARKELDLLSKHEGWYARRYVVEVLRDIPQLGSPAIVERLKKDVDPLVREPVRLKIFQDKHFNDEKPQQ